MRRRAARDHWICVGRRLPVVSAGQLAAVGAGDPQVVAVAADGAEGDLACRRARWPPSSTGTRPAARRAGGCRPSRCRVLGRRAGRGRLLQRQHVQAAGLLPRAG